MRTILMTVCLAVLAVLAAMAGGCMSMGRPEFALLEAAAVRVEADVAHEGMPAPPAAPAAPTVLDAPAASPVAAVEPRRVIYTASLAVLVGDVGAAVEKTRALADELGGYMDRMTRTGITVRVPSPRFNEAIAAITGMGAVTSREIKARDVTEEYVDLAIRLKGAKALHEKMIGLLEKAATVKDALDVEREIARVRTEIEQLEGQMNRLTSQIAYSTISVEFSPTKEAPAAVRTRLPFPWLDQLGIDHLLDILRR